MHRPRPHAAARTVCSRLPSVRPRKIRDRPYSTSPHAPNQPLPSTISTGFTLSLPTLPNPATSDPAYTRILQWYLPLPIYSDLHPKLEAFGSEAVSEQTNSWIANAEKQRPYVKSRNVWGEKYPVDRLVTSEGWKRLGAWGVQNGVVAAGYEERYGPYRRIAQHALNFIYSASSGVYSCPVSMTSGAARLLAHQLPKLPKEHPFHEVYRRILSRDTSENCISAQWMTERPGGSDVRNSETWATYSPLPEAEKKRQGAVHFDEGDWLLTGYKYFCSAADCDVALLLAKTQPSGQLSLFLAPTKRTITTPTGEKKLVSNGISFHRLKTKSGTHPLPTAELEISNLRAWLVGPLDRGIATIATLLNVTRTHNFITALSCWRRGMAIAKGFARERRTIDQPLWMFPMHLRLLGGMEVKFRGLLQLAYFTTSLLSFADNGFPPPSAAYAPLPEPGEQSKIVQRALTATGKAVIVKLSCISLQECQEAMGGVGYLDEPDEPEFNISRLYRDTAANMTWEGTTNVLASEVVRHMLNGRNLEVYSEWFEGKVVQGVRDGEMREKLTASWTALKEEIEGGKADVGAALGDGRQLISSLAWVTCGSLLAHDAQRSTGDGAQDAEAVEVARRWVLEGEGGVGEFALADVVYAGGASRRRRVDAKERVNWDCRLVWGEDLPENAALGYRGSSPAPKGDGQVSGRPEQVVCEAVRSARSGSA